MVLKTSISVKMTDLIANRLSCDEDTYAKLKYGFSIIFINTSKTIIFLICVALLGILKYSLVLLGAYSLVRLFAFGIHLNSSIKCTIFSLCLFIGGTYLAIYAPSLIVANVLILLICFILALIYAPMPTAKRPISDKNRKKFKIKTLFMITLISIVTIYLGPGIYANLIVMGVVLEIINILPFFGKLLIKI